MSKGTFVHASGCPGICHFHSRKKVSRACVSKWSCNGKRVVSLRCQGDAQKSGPKGCGVESGMMTWKQKAIAASAAVVLSFGGIVSPSYAARDFYQVGSDDLFDAMSYTGRWYEIASLKEGFAGEGQEDCHCTQGVYQPRKVKEGIGLTVSTFCFHGGPSGRVSGIQGSVTCADPFQLKLLPEFTTPFERMEKIVEKCVLRFPAIPFIPPEPYDVIETDYKTYALVQGAADTSFVQIYSRTPNPGKEVIDTCLAKLKKLGYPVEKIRLTPQDCPAIPTQNLMEMMSSSQMNSMLTNTMENPSAKNPEEVELKFGGPRNIFSSIVDFFKVSQQSINGS